MFLKELEQKRTYLHNVIEAKKTQLKTLHEEENTFLNELNDYGLCKAEQNNQLKANAKQLKYVDNHLQLLNKLSVLRDIFQINVQPNIATINGLRLGNLKSNPVC